MIKIIIIGALIAMLIFSIVRKLNLFGSWSTTKRLSTPTEIIEISAPLSIYKSAVKKTLITVGIGILILLITIVIASKFKIALFMLPVSFYLIGQFFILNNHLKATKNQRIIYNSKTHEVQVEISNNKIEIFNLLNDVKRVTEVKSVQKNNGILFGYYKLHTQNHTYNIPYIIAQNPQTKPFFDKLQLFDREIETKLFPII
ncbi:hypothetical protein [Sphingobacterium composti Ten et al. 2007 non Yoo et al. 2007]|uniref:hypothetical protein n=1 Tax=Sphingobacterium composti TaxID=363260 RepID=UPI00135C224D|nr:hypothetical protein [Sphingobacterium composti Ten et al. 2007 non Yoo et al. 2007]